MDPNNANTAPPAGASYTVEHDPESKSDAPVEIKVRPWSRVPGGAVPLLGKLKVLPEIQVEDGPAGNGPQILAQQIISVVEKVVLTDGEGDYARLRVLPNRQSSTKLDEFIRQHCKTPFGIKVTLSVELGGLIGGAAGLAIPRGALRLPVSGMTQIRMKLKNCGLMKKDYQRQAADVVRNPDPGTDILKRNKAITKAYADLFQSNPAVFKWAGLAAFASCEVGHAMDQAMRLRGSGLPWLPGVSDISGTKVLQALQIGNAAVFTDIYWQHMVMKRCGLSDLQDLVAKNEMTPEQVQAWEKIDQGQKTGNQDLIWEGNQMLLHYEQSVVLQKGVYDHDRDLWNKLSVGPAILPLSLYRRLAPMQSPVPGDPSEFERFKPGGDLGNFDDRWRWIVEKMVPAWKTLSQDPARVQQLIEPCYKD
jgi:hypothetical protein